MVKRVRVQWQRMLEKKGEKRMHAYASAPRALVYHLVAAAGGAVYGGQV